MAKKKNIERVPYTKFIKAQNDLFQKSIAAYTRTSRLGIDELVAKKRVQTNFYKLVDLLEDFVITDKKNNIIVTVFADQFAYNAKTGEGLVKLTVKTVTPLKGKVSSNEESHNEFIRTAGYSIRKDAVCPIMLFEDLLDAISAAASKAYGLALDKVFGEGIGTDFYD